MPSNLSLLPAEEKNKIEIDKQAAYLVWQLKRGKALTDEVRIQREKLTDAKDQHWFDRSVEKYKRVMGFG